MKLKRKTKEMESTTRVEIKNRYSILSGNNSLAKSIMSKYMTYNESMDYYFAIRNDGYLSIVASEKRDIQSDDFLASTRILQLDKYNCDFERIKKVVL